MQLSMALLLLRLALVSLRGRTEETRDLHTGTEMVVDLPTVTDHHTATEMAGDPPMATEVDLVATGMVGDRSIATAEAQDLASVSPQP
jgi:hypothetical protein